jgi:hypothetical protein
MINYLPFQKMNTRVSTSREDSDIAFFYDLLLYGEFVTKTIALFLVSSINDDKERIKYRQEHHLVRANAIGDFSRTINEVVLGPAAQLLNSQLRDSEQKELMQRASGDEWQYKAQKLLVECLDAFGINHDPLPVKSPLRNWFEFFTLLRNKTRGHGAPRLEPCSTSGPKLEQSIKLIVNNFTAFKRPWAYLYRNLSGRYRVSQLLVSNSFDFLKRENNHNLENGIYCFLDSPVKISFFDSNPELTDFFITNGNLKCEVYEAISYISDTRISLSAKEYLQPISKLPSSHTEGSDRLEIIGNCFTNLPVPTDEYINRTTLEVELTNVLKDEDRFPIATLLGKGGIGKTSLAIKVIQDVAKTNRFDLIIWFSARDIDLLPDGPKLVQTKVLNQKDISDEYCQLLKPGQDEKDSIQFFSNQLTKNSYGKALYVFDNFETVTNPIEIYEWLNTYIRNPNKILITSRISRNFKADFPIEVSGMSENECKSLINIFSAKLHINNILTPSYIDELITESDGHPYIIKILLGEVAKTGKLTKIQRIVQEQDKILQALFKRTFSTLSPAAKRVFLTLCSWNSIIPSVAVESILWRPENEKINVQGAIEELRKSSFIDVINDDSEGFINVPLAALIYGKSELEVYPEKLKILNDRKLLMEFGVTTQSNLSSGVFQRVERKFIEVAKRIKTIEEFKSELPSLEYLASKFPKAWWFIINIFEEYNDYKNVKTSLREYLKTPINHNEKAEAWLKLSDICKMTTDWDGESHALFELALIPNINFRVLSESANRVNYYFKNHPEEHKVEHKKILLNKLIDTMRSRILEGNATDYSRLAWLMINNKDDKNAKIYVKKGLDLEPENQHCLRLKAITDVIK